MFSKSSEFVKAYKAAFETMLSKQYEIATKQEKYAVLVKLISQRIARVKTDTNKQAFESKCKTVYYFSMEFLIGRLLENYLINLEIRDLVDEGLASMGESLESLIECESDPGLGNGGLGRLAACFLDSLAYLGIEGHGMGLRYKFGLFEQRIVDGVQIEVPDDWTKFEYLWEHRKPESAVQVKFGGTVKATKLDDGSWEYQHVSEDVVNAVPYDVPIVGYGGETVNNLRLWSAETVDDKFDLDAFNRGDYSGAVRHRTSCNALTYILYPNDSTEIGKTLRLKQEYLLVAAGVGSIVRMYKAKHGCDLTSLAEKISIHTNDTHPAMCIPELMRILMDEEGLKWDVAWAITTKTISYTNHTILPEAMEKWSIGLFKSILPRIYMIIEEIDRRYKENFDREDEHWAEKLKNTSILWDGQVKMANLSIIGSHSVNGVAALHTEILKERILHDFYVEEPEKFNNKTNGVSHRRFLIQANPKLTKLIDRTIGEDWKTYTLNLKKLMEYQDDKDFLWKLMDVKHNNKEKLSEYIYAKNKIYVNPDSIFDVHVKRIHAYKRQLMCIFKVIAIYNEIKANPENTIEPHTFIFAGKAAQSYIFAKDVIRLINAVAEVVNNDKEINEKLKVVFIENYNLSNAQLIYPATDISEQISTAGYEASGTGNMKFMFNGAITLGTLDGANVEIKEMAGENNTYIFGLTASEVSELKKSGKYSAYAKCLSNPSLKLIMSQLVDGTFGEIDSFRGIHDTLLNSNDEYFVLKDFDSYMEAWYEMNNLYKNREAWARKSLANIANAGYFTSDRTISQYAREIWGLECDAYLDK